MTDQELFDLWKANGPAQIRYDGSHLSKELQTSVTTLQKTIKYRDLREISVAAIMIPVFGFTAFMVPFLLSKIGAGIIVAWCLYLIIRLRKAAKKNTIDSTTSFLDHLKNASSFIVTQRRLLDSVLYWYILPCLSGVMLFFLGFDMPLTQLLLLAAFVLVIGVVVYLLNKHAIKKTLDPLLEQVNNIIKDLNE